MKRIVLSIFFLLLFSKSNFAAHLVGGELSYKCLTNNRYEVTLIIYMDCNNPNGTQLDAESFITIFNRPNNTFLNTASLNLVSRSTVDISEFTRCTSNPPNICLEKGIYRGIVTSLPPTSGGYKIVYQRCCRNASIANINNPGIIGSTYEVDIPGSSVTCNSTPAFRDIPPPFLCVGSRLDYDFSAVDPNGDSLVYSLTAPNVGADQTDPAPTQASRPPYTSVSYSPTFSATRPLGTNSIISINPLSGQLIAVPNSIGQFVVGIKVDEYRNGVRINSVVRDFQFNVEDCINSKSFPAIDTATTDFVSQLDDSTYFVCSRTTIQFKNNSTRANTFLWDFGIPNRTDDISTVREPLFTFPDTGFYRVVLVSDPGNPCSDTTVMRIRLNPRIVANFNFTNNVCAGTNIFFRDSSFSELNDINEWKWKVGTDSFLTTNHAQTFNTPGTFPVQLTVTTPRGCIGRATKNVIINPSPNTDFNLRQVCYDIRTLFTNTSTITNGTITKYYWNFGNGQIDSTNVNPTTNYPSNGNYNVQLIALSANGCKDTIQKNVSIIDSLKPNFTFPASNCQQSAVQFSNTSTGNYTGYTWSFRDNLNSSSTAVNPNFTYPTAGTFPVKLEVNHAICGKDTIVKNVLIKPKPTVALQRGIAICNGTNTQLSVPATFDSVRWNTNETTNTITVNGSRNPISIQVYKDGCSNSDATTLTVSPLPNADFNLRQVCYGIRSLYTNTSTIASGTITKYYWSFGNGNTDSVNVNPTTTYPSNNNYNVQLIAVSNIGCRDTTIKSISIIDSLKPNFIFPSSNCQQSATQFTNTSTGNYTGFTWNFRDNLNSASTTANPSFTYQNAGTFPVKLTVTHAICGQDSISKSITIKPKPSIVLTKNIPLCEGAFTQISAPSVYDSVRWNTNETSNTITVNGSINPIRINVFKDGCSNTDATTLIIKPKPVADFATNKICSNKPTAFLNTSAVASPDSLTQFSWNINNGALTSSLKNPIFNLNQITTYNTQLIVTTNSNCKDTFRNILALVDTFIPKLVIPNSICLRSEAQFTDSSKGDNINFLWSFGDGQTSAIKNPTHTYNTQGTYTVGLTVQNKNCGSDSTSGTFTVRPLPPISLDDNIIMCPDEIRSIFARGDFDSIFWSTGSLVNPTTINGNISPVYFTGYKLGCKSTDSIRVIQNCDIFIPTAFSPNNDGENDEFNFIPVNILSYTLSIYNRWGELVFETNDLRNNWNGTYKGLACPVDDYVYVASGIKKDSTSFSVKGTLTLLR